MTPAANMEELKETVRHIDAQLHQMRDSILEGLSAKTQGDRTWAKVERIALSILTPLCLAGVYGLFSMHSRLVVVETTRFTAKDYQEAASVAAADRAAVRTILETVRADLGRVSERLARMEARMDVNGK